MTVKSVVLVTTAVVTVLLLKPLIDFVGMAMLIKVAQLVGVL